jgi:hypothetical protein
MWFDVEKLLKGMALKIFAERCVACEIFEPVTFSNRICLVTKTFANYLHSATK